MAKEQFEGWDEAYKVIKKKGFENYFVLPDTTWKDVDNNIKEGRVLEDEYGIMRLKEDIRIVLSLKNKKLPICKECKQIFSPQEFKAGFELCEHCQAKKSDGKGKHLNSSSTSN